jgi:hypothetical protein
MKIMGLGINYSTGKALVPPMGEEDFANKINQLLEQNASEIRELTRTTSTATTFRGEIEKKPTPDLSDPRAAGWTFLVNEKDPSFDAMIETIRPLAEHRGMENPSHPLLYRGEQYGEWFDWITENYSSLYMEKVPMYALIIGGPDQVPFEFQSMFSSAAAVGRVCFDSMSELANYVEKVLRLEKAAAPVPTRSAILCATDGGMNDPTFFSRKYMVEPLVQYVKDDHSFHTTTLLGEEATKDRLANALSHAKPALVYTASHGLGAPDQDPEIQLRYNGAICCQQDGKSSMKDWLLSADDLPKDKPFLEGSVFFQFACFGYGTPAQSDYMHWLGNPELNAKKDFVAAIPKRLLANPRGPLAYIGHVDTAWLHGFDDPEEPHILERWHPRIAPFVKAVDELLDCRPPGLAMRDMCKRYDVCNAQLTTTFDRLQRGKLKPVGEFHSRLASLFITRSDAQNYMVFGDPAVQIRISDE